MDEPYDGADLTSVNLLICSLAVQILYNGHLHWVATAYTNGTVYLIDSLAGDHLPSTLEEQIAMIYQDVVRDHGLLVTRVPVQQQMGSTDCGLFAIAYAFYAAWGNQLTKLCFDQSKMRQHLLECFQQQKLTAFP